MQCVLIFGILKNLNEIKKKKTPETLVTTYVMFRLPQIKEIHIYKHNQKYERK